MGGNFKTIKNILSFAPFILGDILIHFQRRVGRSGREWEAVGCAKNGGGIGKWEYSIKTCG